MSIDQIFTTYWSQMTLLLIAISYFIKRIFDMKSRKTEINHTVFQQKRLEAIERFMLSVAETENMWYMLSIYDVMNRRLKSTELDGIIFPHLNKLKSNLLQVKMYLDDSLPFEKIVNNMLSVNQTLSRNYFEYNPDITTTHKVNDYQITCEEINSKNAELIKQANKIIRKAFE